MTHSQHAPRAPHPIDAYVGNRIRAFRQVRKMSQEALGDHLGVSFQQCQKYENGKNRVSASRLYVMAEALQVPVQSFFDGYNDAETATEEQRANAQIVDTFIQSQNGPIMMEAFVQLPKDLQKQAIGVVRALVPAS